MTNAAFFVGAPLEFRAKCLVYPPTVREVVTNPFFSQFMQLLTQSQEDINDELLPKLEPGAPVPTPLELLLENSQHNKAIEAVSRKAFEFFVHMPVNFLYDQKWVILGDLKEIITNLKDLSDLVYISNDDFFDFQNLIREACGLKTVAPFVDDPTEDPRVKRIKAKARYRDRIKAKKGSKDGITLLTSLVSICCMGIGITPLNIGEMSYASIGPIFSMFQGKEKYDLDIRALLAGASSKKVHPQYWIKND